MVSFCQTLGMEVDHLVGAAATKESTQATGVVHFATHGILQKTGCSALALSGHDGFMNSQDLQGLDLEARAAILSSCNTGRGKLKAEGVMGLPRAFIAAGVPSTVPLSMSWKPSIESGSKEVRIWPKLYEPPCCRLLASQERSFSLNTGLFALVGCSYKAQDVMPLRQHVY